MLHPWNLSPDKAIALQNELRQKLVLAWDGRPVHTVGGVDVSVKTDVARAAIVVFTYPGLKPRAAITADAPLTFPYVPGLLAFREIPAILEAWSQLAPKPDIVMIDGQGIAHPRRMGIASHLGLWIQRPAIGVAKSRLYGRHDEPGPEAGDRAPLYDSRRPDVLLGSVVRLRPKSNPVYVSPGHLIDLEHSVEFVLACAGGYRLPEPTRWAHKVGAGEPFPVDEEQQPRLL